MANPGAALKSVGLTLIFGGALILRQVAVGRATYLRQDTHDFAVAALNGDTATVTQVAARRGTNLPAGSDISVGGVVQSGITAVAGGVGASTLISEMRRLAAVANNQYEWGKTGPNSYDCSGLVWRAMYNLGYYKGARFTTDSFPNVAQAFATRVSGAPMVGDIVVWPRTPGHMGVVIGNDAMYSALNSRVGIVNSPISAIHGETPQYFRLGPAVAKQNVGRAF